LPILVSLRLLTGIVLTCVMNWVAIPVTRISGEGVN
jgi:hypothetical protein